MYSVDYFIKKFSAIPDELWCVRGFNGPGGSHCAAGHCGMDGSCGGWLRPEAIGIRELFDDLGTDIAYVNDGGDERYKQPTPKARILAALYAIKAKQTPPPSLPPLTLAPAAWPMLALPVQAGKVGVV